MARGKAVGSLKRKADSLFSQWVREEGRCEWCGSTQNLQCAHIFTRTYNSTRYDPLNAVCLCAKCHWRWHKEPVEGVEWIRNYLGDNIYEELRYQAKVKIEKTTTSYYEEVIRKLKAKEAPYVR